MIKENANNANIFGAFNLSFHVLPGTLVFIICDEK